MASKASKQYTGKDWLKALIGGAVLCLLGIGILKACGYGEPKGIDPGNPLANCRNAVEQQVKNPASIDWDLLSTEITDTRITGTFSAQNDFGAMKSLSFECVMSNGQVTSARVLQG